MGGLLKSYASHVAYNVASVSRTAFANTKWTSPTHLLGESSFNILFFAFRCCKRPVVHFDPHVTRGFKSAASNFPTLQIRVIRRSFLHKPQKLICHLRTKLVLPQHIPLRDIKTP